MKTLKKDVCIFDLDGTLIDSVPDLALSINRMLADLERPSFEENTIRFWVGNGARMLVKRALQGGEGVGDPIDQDLVESALEIFLRHYERNLSTRTVPYPTVIETLDRLQASGRRMGIITNKPVRFLNPILSSLCWDDKFELVLGGDSLDRQKPDPLPLRYFCEQLDVMIERCVMIGDSRNDIAAARAAGMDVIAVSYGYNYGESISIYKPDRIVDCFDQILPILGE